MDSALYDRIKEAVPAAGIFDITVDPDWQYVDNAPAIVAAVISDVPESSIDGVIIARPQRVQFNVLCPDLTTAREAKEALIAALHGWAGGSIKRVTLENGGPELFDNAEDPTLYHLPIDFFVTQ